MKNVFFIILFFILTLGEVLNAQQINFDTSWGVKREIPLKDIKKGKGGKGSIQRSVTFVPIVAYISGNTIGLDFLAPIAEEITVVITNANTGEIIYSENYYSPDNIIIQLNEGAVDYHIDIVSESLILQGEFTL